MFKMAKVNPLSLINFLVYTVIPVNNDRYANSRKFVIAKGKSYHEKMTATTFYHL